MTRLKLYLLGKLMVWFAKREGASEEDIDSGVTVVTVNELKALESRGDK